MELLSECAAVAFYGFAPSGTATRAFYEYVTDWMPTIQCPPDKISLRASGWAKGWRSFRRTDPRLRAGSFDAVQGFEISCQTPGAVAPAEQWRVYVMLSHARSYCTVTGHLPVVDLEAGSLLPTAEAMARTLQPAYGIGYRLDFKRAPHMYSVGLNGGWELWGAERVEADRVNRWGDELDGERRYQQGWLRDVYAWNFLREPHLNQPVGGRSLREWIEAAEGRGKLEPFAAGMTFWSVPETHLPEVRDALGAAGLLIAYP